MSKDFAATINTSDLQIGTTLSFDLLDNAGVVLHKAGLPISERLLERLASKGIHSLRIIGRIPSAPKNPKELLLSSYDSRVVDNIKNAATRAENALCNMAGAILNGVAIDTQEIKSSVSNIVEQAAIDASATLAIMAARATPRHAQLQNRLTNRSANMAMLAVTTSMVMGCSPVETQEVGLAGMLHDSSLIANSDRLERAERNSPRVLLELRNHALDSAETLRSSNGINERVCLALSQVHEQFDGSGYPRGTAGSQILTSAKILNLADAYLSLVQPIFKDKQYLPSDAIAHLVHHAALRRFEPQVVKAFIAGLSMYPIGSQVSLDDSSEAIIVRSDPKNPLKPMVKLTGGSNTEIDLSKSDRSIKGPSTQIDPSVLRISKTMMDQQLWRDDVGVLASA
jgi:HD-GYP domain-containing protein (c-di-GMP phosphodiesterase class II)